MSKLVTEMELKAFTDKDVGRRILDGEGLVGAVSLDRSGSVVVVFKYRYRSPITGTVRDTACGKWPELKIAQIRKERDKYKEAVRSGVDPVESKRASKLAEQTKIEEDKAASIARMNELATMRARTTVSAFFERWASVELSRHKDGGEYARAQMVRHALPVIGDIPVEDVRKGHITEITARLLADGKNRTAKVALSLVRQMFRYAQDEEVIEFDPSSAIRKARTGGKETERERALSESEIKALVVQLPKANLSESAQAAVWLALSTCCRIGELLKARWEHVDLDKGSWWIPPENSKNGKPHTVHLSDFSKFHFQALRDAAGLALKERRIIDPNAKPLPWVYPNRGGDDALCPKTITKQIGDRQRGDKTPMKGRANQALANTLELPGGRWMPHDLRRTGATMMVALGVMPDVVERCLNHAEENKVKRTYLRHSYEPEMREAWRLLGERLELLKSGADNVITLKRPA